MAQISFWMQLEGMERKKVAELVGQALGVDARYEGPPNFTYECGGWRVGKDGTLNSPFMDDELLNQAGAIAIALRDASVMSTGTMTVYAFGLPQQVSINIENILRSKANLMEQAFPCDQDKPFSRGEHAVRMAFLSATLEPDALRAYLLFVMKLIEFAGTLNRVTAREREVTNARYQMRVWLLRMGFIGGEYAKSRKLLMKNLPGNGAWRSGSAPVKQPPTSCKSTQQSVKNLVY